MHTSIGIDIGGTKIETVVLEDDSGKELFCRRVATPANYPDFLAAVTNVIKEAAEHASPDFNLGIGIPGLVFPDKEVENYNNLAFVNPNFVYDLESRINHKIYIANDANCFAFSEALDGAGKDYASVFGIISGTGIGGGLVVNGKVISGFHSLSGEWGHLSLPFPKAEESKILCKCGQYGCIEALISGPALIKSYHKISDLRIDTVSELHTLAKDGDRAAQQVIETFLNRFARALLVIICTIDPDVIVLGGGLSNIADIYTRVPNILTEYTKRFNPYKRFHLNLQKAMHGDSSGVRGAAWLWKYQSKSG